MHNFGMSPDALDAVRSACAGVPGIDEVVVFGSRAMGNAKPGSDVDLAVKGVSLGDDDIVALRSALEALPLVPFFFDVVRYDAIDTPALKEHIDTYGKMLFRR